MKKRILALLLVLAMVLSATPSYAIAVEEDSTVSVGTAEDLSAALAAGGKIQLLNSIVVSQTLTIPVDTIVTLDLAGYTVSMNHSETVTANHEMILNKGNLTIQNTKGDGKLSYQYTGANVGTCYAVNTITSEPGSVLYVKGGTIENLTYDSGIIAYAIDGRTNGGTGDVTVNISGGTITSQRQSVRIFANSTSHTGTLNISGGTITGRVIVQNASASANKAALNITGGIFNANAYKTDVLSVGGSNGATIAMTPVISGGTFNGEITSNISGSFITGGSYQYVYTNYIVNGYDAVLVDDYYIVHMHDTLTDIPAVDATCTETGLTAGKKCSICGTVMSGVAEVPASGHSWSTDFQPGTDTHWQYCKNDCGTKQNEATHTFVEKIDNVYIVADSANDCAVEYVKSCSVCGKGHETETFWVKKDAPEHTYNAGLVTAEPTCTATGVKTYTCINEHCGHTKTKTIPAKGHTEVEIAGKDATCTETGFTAGKKCSVCGTVTVEQTVVDKKGHTLTKVPANAATYFAAGNIAHYTCADCGTLFADAEGTKEVTLADVTLAQLVKIEDTTADVSNDVVEDVIKEAVNAGTMDIVITVTQDKLADDNKEDTAAPAPDEDDSTDTPEPPATEPVVTKTQLPVAAVEQVADLHEEATLTINMTNATVTMDKTTLDVVTEKAKTEQTDVIALEIEHIKTEELAPVQQIAVEDKTVAAVISASILVNDKEVHDFEGGKVTVAIPFTPEAGATASDYIVLYIADDGTIEEIPSTVADGKLVMTLSHFSEYVVVNTAAPKDTTNPDTGDVFNPVVMVMLMAASAAGIIILSDKKRFAK